MTILKAKKAREMNDKEINEKLKDIYLELSKEKATSEIGGSVKNPGRIRDLRLAIARIKTERGRRAASIDVKTVKSSKAPSGQEVKK